MIQLEYYIKDEFKKYNLGIYYEVKKDCYRLTIFDDKKNQIMLFPKKIEYNQTTDFVKYLIEYSKKKAPEFFI